MKAFIVNEITDWDKLKVWIEAIAGGEGQSKSARRDQVKLYIIVGEVFQFQILEYLPSIFGVLNDKLAKEGRINSSSRCSSGRSHRGDLRRTARTFT